MKKSLLLITLLTPMTSALLTGCGDRSSSKKADPTVPAGETPMSQQDLVGEWTHAQTGTSLKGHYTGLTGKTVRFEHTLLFRFTKDSFAHVLRCVVSVEGVTQTLEAVTERKAIYEGNHFQVAEGGENSAVAKVNGEDFICGNSEVAAGDYTFSSFDGYLLLDSPQDKSFLLDRYTP
ncbi:MAG TPA: hypothetical protein VE954_08655 [Oligoflexus sp.]|uniref:hypothetical protein n=1 Tax=Oligoflexus sp. TaxID=1971216 RepID=UPI002D489D9F|nr:hypothetical protein [Oligoflexus sp.]HYX33172.1 hypothetical protein [Oligoflexus sp.]